MSEPYDLISKGIDFVSQDEFSKAEQYILRGIKEYERHKDKDGLAFALGQLGYCYEKAGQLEKAREVYEKAIQIGTDIPMIYQALISILVIDSQFDKAFEVSEIWQQNGSRHLTGKAQGIFIHLSSRLVREERYDNAIHILNHLLSYFPREQGPEHYWRIRGLIGNAHEKKTQLDEAMQIYAKAISEGSKDTFTYKRYLINLEKQKEYRTALTIVKKAFKIKKDAAWEADLKKRKQRLEKKTGLVPKKSPKALIPDFSIRAGGSNLSLIQQIKFSPQLSHLAISGDHFYGTTGGKTPKLICHRLGNKERTWDITLEGNPAGLFATNAKLIVYTREGRIGEGETNIFFYDGNGNLETKQRLPDVPSQVVTIADQLYAGCRNGKLYAFSIDGQSLWSYSMPDSSQMQNDNYSRPCPYYVSAGKDVVAFTSYGTVYVLNNQGKLNYIWETQERVETSKTEYFTMTISSGNLSVTALAAAPTGKSVLVASRGRLFELVDGKEVKRVPTKLNSINQIYWMEENKCGIYGTDKFVVMDRGKISARVPLKGFGQMAYNNAANRLVVWSGNNLHITTLDGKKLAKVEFVKNIHTVNCLENGQILVGTRYVMLFDSNPEPQEAEPEKPAQQPEVTPSKSSELKKTNAIPKTVEENGIPVSWIEAQKITHSRGKALYKGPDGGKITIEQVVLNEYILRGYWGAWTENNYWLEIMTLLFWDVIFAKLPGAYTPQFGNFPSEMQDMPQDFFTSQFYTRRKQMIEKRIQILLSNKLFGLVKTSIEKELRATHQRYYGKPCRPIENWECFSIDSLAMATKALTKEALMLIMKRLLENFSENRSGLPDLFLVGADGKLLLVEVKGEKETVADHQLMWLHFLNGKAQVSVEICRVKSM